MLENETGNSAGEPPTDPVVFVLRWWSDGTEGRIRMERSDHREPLIGRASFEDLTAALDPFFAG